MSARAQRSPSKGRNVATPQGDGEHHGARSEDVSTGPITYPFRWLKVKNVVRSSAARVSVAVLAAAAVMIGLVVTLAGSRESSRSDKSMATYPLTGVGPGVLDSVSCSTNDTCIAVGREATGKGSFRALIGSWNGTHWSVGTSPAVTASDSYLYGVSCPSATFCMAVGAASNGTTNGSLIEEWNASVWSIVPSPRVGARTNTLNGVTCVSADSCTAVGGYFGNGGLDKTLVESWNGSKWVVVSSPDIGLADQLHGVTCVSTTSCLAVGDYVRDVARVYRLLIVSWNGTKWKVESGPSASIPPSYLQGVSCGLAATCIAVGSHLVGMYTHQLIVRQG